MLTDRDAALVQAAVNLIQGNALNEGTDYDLDETGIYSLGTIRAGLLLTMLQIMTTDNSNDM
jgi:hypothetical protein